MIFEVYVDDLIIKVTSEIKFEELIKKLKIFEMTNLGLSCSSFGIEVHQGNSHIALCQTPY